MKKSSSSKPMEQSKTQKELLELGKSLVEELRLDTGDTLGRWMAHYVAELLKDAERAEGEERFTKSEICATMIMRLWDHRNQFPEENRPFKEFTNVFTSLENLSLDVEKTKYWAETRNLARGASVNKESKKWLAVADGVDDTAKILIRYCLTKASENKLDKATKWVDLAENAGLDDAVDIQVIRFIQSENELLTTKTLDDKQKKQALDRITKLESFIKIATALLGEMKEIQKNF
ncbi:MAG: hypothetical protein LCH54_03835 [Bacteroidetes bacterium]|nr:hypothetical protein [Bacteroidota bacterium]